MRDLAVDDYVCSAWDGEEKLVMMRVLGVCSVVWLVLEEESGLFCVCLILGEGERGVCLITAIGRVVLMRDT